MDKVLPAIIFKKNTLRKCRRALFFFIHSVKNGLGGGTYEWEQAVKKLGSGRKAGSSVPHSSSPNTHF